MPKLLRSAAPGRASFRAYVPLTPGFAGAPGAARRVLDRLAARVDPSGALPDDPVLLVHEFADPDDREIAALLAALLAYGRVQSIRTGVRGVLDQLGPHPADALRRGVHRRRGWAAGFQYRWTHRRHLRGLLDACAITLEEEGSLGRALALRVDEHGAFEPGLSAWIDLLRGRAARYTPDDRGLRFLLPRPGSGGACKRLRLFLRWMIRRDDGVDLGTWGDLLSPAHLVVPLDTHWIRMAPRLGLTARRSADGRMAAEITEALRRVDPGDPLRFDFAICHLGISGHCPRTLTPADCRRCPLRRICHMGRAVL